jgi:hypothetical protein
MDLSGSGNHASVSGPDGTVYVVANASTATLNNQPYLHGSSQSRVIFPPAILPAVYTLFHVTKWDGPTRYRILTASNINWLSGHWHGESGAVHHDAWMLRGEQNSNWTLTYDQKSFARVNRSKSGGGGRSAPRGVGINQFGGQYNNERSDWACAEIVVFDGALSEAEGRAVEQYFVSKYGL